MPEHLTTEQAIRRVMEQGVAETTSNGRGDLFIGFRWGCRAVYVRRDGYSSAIFLSGMAVITGGGPSIVNDLLLAKAIRSRSRARRNHR